MRAFLFAALLVLAGCDAYGSGGSDGSDSGIEGQVLIGPVDPVQQVGQESYVPYEGRLQFVDVPARSTVRFFSTNTEGRFRVGLPAGSYQVTLDTDTPSEGIGQDPLPAPDPQMIAVTDGRYTEVELRFDTGIR
ncbi:MAG: hypothetical protein AAGI08_06185 [Bacteroidota bacterium]